MGVVHSGKDGTLKVGGSEESEVVDWEWEDMTETHPYHTNESGSARKRLAGIDDSSGTFNMLDKPSFTKGSIVSLACYTDQDIMSGSVIIRSIRPRVPIDGGDPVSYAVAFEGCGPVAWSTGSAP